MTCKNRKEQAAERRDERAAKGPEEHKPVSAKKDTKAWCKGVRGRAHRLGIVEVRNPRGELSRIEQYCKACGKTLDTWWNFSMWPQPKPDWLLKHEKVPT